MRANKIRIGRIFSALAVITLVIATLKFANAATTQVTWTDNATNEDSFVIERREFSETSYTVVGVIIANSITYSDEVVDGFTYCYRVGATNTAGTGYSGEYCISVPTAPEPPATDPDPPPVEEEPSGKPKKKPPNPNKPIK